MFTFLVLRKCNNQSVVLKVDLLLLLSEVLSPKDGPIKAKPQAGGTLTQTVKQPYGLCCLAGHVFK